MNKLHDIPYTKELIERLYMASGNLPPARNLNDLRLAILEGYDPTPEEMLLIVNDARRDRRRAAARATAAPATIRKKKTEQVPITKERLLAILNEEHE